MNTQQFNISLLGMAIVLNILFFSNDYIMGISGLAQSNAEKNAETAIAAIESIYKHYLIDLVKMFDATNKTAKVPRTVSDHMFGKFSNGNGIYNWQIGPYVYSGAELGAIWPWENKWSATTALAPANAPQFINVGYKNTNFWNEQIRDVVTKQMLDEATIPDRRTWGSVFMAAKRNPGAIFANFDAWKNAAKNWGIPTTTNPYAQDWYNEDFGAQNLQFIYAAYDLILAEMQKAQSAIDILKRGGATISADQLAVKLTEAMQQVNALLK